MIEEKRSIKFKERFVSDNNLPIQIFYEPYFSYYINLYEDLYNTKTKWDYLNNIIINEYNNNENLFLDEYYKYRNLIIKDIENKNSYKDFINKDMNYYGVKTNISSKDIYSETNDNKYFLSIDIVKSNFNILKWFKPNIINNSSTYSEFISGYINNPYMAEYFINSKYTRQVIFGKLNAKRQITLSKYYINKLYNDYFNNKNELLNTNLKIMSLGSDEIIFKFNDDCDIYKINEIYNLVTKLLGTDAIELNIEVFKLIKHSFKTHNNNIINVYEKYYDNKPSKYKNISITYHAQIYKHLFNKKIDNYDLYFLNDKQIARYEYELFNIKKLEYFNFYLKQINYIKNDYADYNQVIWSDISKIPNLDIEFIEEFKFYLDWSCISQYYRLIDDLFIKTYKEFIDWNIILKRFRLSEEIIKLYLSLASDKYFYPDIRIVFQTQTVSEKFIDEYLPEYKDIWLDTWNSLHWAWHGIDNIKNDIKNSELFECYDTYFVGYALYNNLFDKFSIKFKTISKDLVIYPFKSLSKGAKYVEVKIPYNIIKHRLNGVDNHMVIYGRKLKLYDL